MRFFDRLFGRRNANEAARPLYNAVVARGREPHWYRVGGVADTIDGRFEMIAATLSLVIARLELETEQRRHVAWLTELFVTDMDGQLRESGVGDLVVGKHVGRLVSALGGRLGAFREALSRGAGPAWTEAVVRNATLRDDAGVDPLAAQLLALREQLASMDTETLLAGELPQ